MWQKFRQVIIIIYHYIILDSWSVMRFFYAKKPHTIHIKIKIILWWKPYIVSCLVCCVEFVAIHDYFAYSFVMKSHVDEMLDGMKISLGRLIVFWLFNYWIVKINKNHDKYSIQLCKWKFCAERIITYCCILLRIEICQRDGLTE